MSTLQSVLKQLKNVPKFKDVTFNNINKELASKLLIRYKLLTIVYRQLYEVGVTMMPSIDDILSLKPIVLNGEIFKIDNVVATAFSEAVKARDEGFESVIDILRLYNQSTPIEFSAIKDSTVLEFLYRLPSIGEIRNIRMVKLENNAYVYFSTNRFMLLVNSGEVNTAEDQNYFITIIDLGSFYFNLFVGKENVQLDNPTQIARFERIPFTGKPRHVNTKLVLWDVVKHPCRYYWFVHGNNIKRTNYTFELLFGGDHLPPQHTLSNEVWGNYRREFGILVKPKTIPYRRPKAVPDVHAKG